MELDLNNRLILFCGGSRLMYAVRSILKEDNIRTASCSSSPDALHEALKTYSPDILVYVCGLDDELNISRISAAAGQMPGLKIIAAAFNNWEDRLAAYENAGAMRAVVLPMDSRRFAFRLRNHLIFNSKSRVPDIADFLFVKGFTTGTMGFLPLCRMVEICCARPCFLRQPVKYRLTYNVAMEFGYKPVNLDRLIRYIAVREDEKRTLSRMTYGKVWWRPGNMSFIAIICDKYLTFLNGSPHKLPRNAQTFDPVAVIKEIKAKKKKRRWIYVGKPKAD